MTKKYLDSLILSESELKEWYKDLTPKGSKHGRAGRDDLSYITPQSR